MFLVVPRLEYWLVTWIREIAELFNDFYEYDPVSYTWSNLTDLSQFSSVYPPPRKSHGFASSGTKLYVFGGQVSKSGNMELISLFCPLTHTIHKQARYQTIYILGTRHLLRGAIIPIFY
jgi:hypothetical protein